MNGIQGAIHIPSIQTSNFILVFNPNHISNPMCICFNALLSNNLILNKQKRKLDKAPPPSLSSLNMQSTCQKVGNVSSMCGRTHVLPGSMVNWLLLTLMFKDINISLSSLYAQSNSTNWTSFNMWNSCMKVTHWQGNNTNGLSRFQMLTYSLVLFYFWANSHAHLVHKILTLYVQVWSGSPMPKFQITFSKVPTNLMMTCDTFEG